MAVDAGLRQLFRIHLPRFDICTIEMGVTSTGAPDINYCYQGVEGWIECKRADHWRTKVRTDQIGWAERRLDHGGRVLIAVRRAWQAPRSSPIGDELWMFHGWHLRDLAVARLDEVPCLGRWSRGPKNWDWDAVAELMTRPWLLV